MLTSRISFSKPEIRRKPDFFTTSRQDKEIDRLQQQFDTLTKKRGTSWEQVNDAPERIHFISFAGDTTWYLQEKMK